MTCLVPAGVSSWSQSQAALSEEGKPGIKSAFHFIRIVSAIKVGAADTYQGSFLVLFIATVPLDQWLFTLWVVTPWGHISDIYMTIQNSSNIAVMKEPQT